MEDQPFETPREILEELAEPELPSPLHEPELPKPRRSFGKFILRLLLFAALFFIGVWLSSSLRQFIPPGSQPTEETNIPVPSPITTSALFPTPTVTAPWRIFEVANGKTRQQIAGLTLNLPDEVLTPVCDDSSCMSQGTYLPGGTRLTIASRGTGQALPNTKGAILTDAASRRFEMKDATVAGFPATEFTGNFTGTTIGGYTFTRIRGYMIYLTDTLTLELSHFAPSGTSADFEADSRVFEQIANSIQFTR